MRYFHVTLYVFNMSIDLNEQVIFQNTDIDSC